MVKFNFQCLKSNLIAESDFPSGQMKDNFLASAVPSLELQLAHSGSHYFNGAGLFLLLIEINNCKVESPLATMRRYTNVGLKLHFWPKRLFCLFILFNFEWMYWGNLMIVKQISFARLFKIAIKVAHLRWFAVQRNTGCFSNYILQWFFLENRSQDRIAGKRHILHDCWSLPCFQNGARDCWYSISFAFFNAFSPKALLDFVNMNC